MKKGLRAIVSGRVQGVSFRWFTRRKARQMGLCGHAKNLVDGRVEVLAFGGIDELDQLKLWLGEGSPLAYVEQVESHEIKQPEGIDIEAFNIL